MRIGGAWLVAGTGLAVLAGAVLAGAPQRVNPPKARYYMDVTTASGMPKVSLGAMFGRGRMGSAAPQHELLLRLGSTLAPTGGAAQADHFMPAGMQLGPSVPLATPVPGAPAKPGESEPGTPGGVKRPTGRLLLFWGCGAHVGAGQPVVIDFAKVAQGQFPPNLFSVSVPADRGPTYATSRTYGDWPNAIARAKQQVPPGGSLIGEHRVAGNYAPEIRFSLAQDFMAPLNARSADGAGGTVDLAWDAVASATGYYAWALGANGMANGRGDGGADVVWWTSAGRQEFGGGLTDWLAPSVVARLIGQRIVMPPSQTSCQIPAEVKAAAGPAMISFLYAYGPEAEFAYPPRPANPKLAWSPDWTAKARFRSTAMIFPSMGALMRGASAGEEGQAQPKKKCKPNLAGALGGMFGRRSVGGAVAGAAQGAAESAAQCR